MEVNDIINGSRKGVTVSSTKTKTFTISDPSSLSKVDAWWASLLKAGPKEIVGIDWISNGDLIWNLRLTWAKLDIDSPAFKVCMPAYAGFSVDDLNEFLATSCDHREHIKTNLAMFKKKLDDWEVIELEPDNGANFEDYDSPDEDLSFGIDPSLSYASKLDVVEKIMVSEFLWPYYKSMVRTYLMLEAKIAEIQTEIEQRADISFAVVHVDRGMLRSAFKDQIGYDNKWLFASDDEIFEDYYGPDEDAE